MPPAQEALVERALMLGINLFDLTFPPAARTGGASQVTIPESLRHLRDDMVLSTQAGFHPRGGLAGFGSRKSVLSSLNSILRRTGLDYIDILWMNRFDRMTPMEETMGALSSLVRQDKVLYVGLAGYAPAPARRAAELLRELGTPAIACLAPFSLINPWVEDGLLDTLDEQGISLLADSLLSNFLVEGTTWRDSETLSEIAAARGQTPASLSLSWVLRDRRVASALIKVASGAQLEESCMAADHMRFTPAEIDAVNACRARLALY